MERERIGTAIMVRRKMGSDRCTKYTKPEIKDRLTTFAWRLIIQYDGAIKDLKNVYVLTDKSK